MILHSVQCYALHCTDNKAVVTKRYKLHMRELAMDTSSSYGHCQVIFFCVWWTKVKCHVFMDHPVENNVIT